MTSKDLPDDILSRFLEETKAAEQKKKKPEKIELPKNFVVYDQKAAIKKRRDEALAALKGLTNHPEEKKVNIGSVMATKMKNPSPSLGFTAKSTKEQKEKKGNIDDDKKEIDEYEEEESY